MKTTLTLIAATALSVLPLTAPALAQTTNTAPNSETTTPSTTPANRTSQSGLQPSTQQTKEPKQTGSVAQRNNRQAAKKTDDQHK